MLRSIYAVVVILVIAGSGLAAQLTATLKAGKADVKFAGPLAFGPDGILFVGDSLGAAVYAIDTGDRTEASLADDVAVTALDRKIAAMLGTSADQLMINDIAVNPISKNVYISVSRGRAPTGQAVIVRVEPGGRMGMLSLDNVKHARTTLDNASTVRYRGRGWRMESITDLAFVNDRVYVAGMSNEEFASNLRTIPFPFVQSAAQGTSVEIFHGSHGRWETNAPVRTFVPYTSKQTAYILAAYTCTPLVKLPISALTPGSKATGTTIADFGGGNRPLDMIVYRKDGRDYLLMTSNARAVMKLDLEDVDSYRSIESQTDNLGADIPYEALVDLQRVDQLDLFDDRRALLLVVTQSGSVDLKTVPLP